jgi:cytochrome c553
MKATAALAAMLLLCAAQASDDFAPRVQPCATCHGEQGRATADGYYPRIAGKPAGYLFEQLLNFRDGHRSHELMRYLVKRQREDYLREMAEHFAALELPYAAPIPARAAASTLARGESLVRQGDAARGLPACEACHGAALTGLQPAVPGLIGLPYDYLAAQLGAWRSGLRRARAPDCMADIAKALAPADIEALAAWLAAQPVPVDAKAPSGQVASDMACGSLEPRR